MAKTIGMIIYLLLSVNLFAQDGAMMRYPNANSQYIVFSSAGDIYVSSINGGIARKLTSSPGTEEFPRISPDGKFIAFTAEYDGNYDIYYMPISGGEPIRLTYTPDLPDMKGRERMGPAKIIMQWTADSKKILYRARNEEWNSLAGRLYTVSLDGGLPEQIPLPRAGFGNFLADENSLVYNRIYREYRTWKHYRGGQADDIWLYNFKTKTTENLTNNPAQDIIPMYCKGNVYFLSDREHTMNLFKYETSSKQVTKITNFTEYDVKFPSATNEYVSFENGGDIYILDPQNDTYKKIEIIVNDESIWARNEIINVKKYINNFDVAPDASYMVMSARGDIFRVPSDKGVTYNLTKSSNAHDRNACISPDGRFIAYISDESGETEVYLIRPNGTDKTKLTNDAKSYRYELDWSPNSRYLLCSDKLNQLYYIDIETGKAELITKSKQWEIRSYKWSPDSKWVVYNDNINNQTPVLFLYSLATKEKTQITDEYFESYNPEFSQDGKLLYFVSKRTFSPEVGEFEWNYSYSNMAKIYAYILEKDGKNPFVIEEKHNNILAIDELIDDDVADKPEKKKSKAKKEKQDIDSTLKIDLENLKTRIIEFPVQNGEYLGLKSIKDKLYYTKVIKGNSPKLFVFDLKEKDEKEVGEVGNYVFSADNKKIAFNINGEYYISEVKAQIKAGEGKLDLSSMNMNISHKQEWNQIFDECWRQMRDFFYDSNMHGVDWNIMKDRYSRLLLKVRHRSDLTYVIGELIGELNIGHAYVGGGDKPQANEKPLGLLGAKFELDNSGSYRIKSIYEGRNWEENTRSPLTEAGVNINVGDYLIAIDDIPLSGKYSPYVALINKPNNFVKLTINSKPNKNGAKDYIVKTISSESGLVYFNWVENNRRYVEKKTNGQVGYIHIPDMSMDGLNEFVKYFYPQVRKSALIIDDRGNGGGNVSPMIIERLRRILAVAKNARNQETVFTNPSAVMTGPMVMLINQLSMSDGDLFPYQFHAYGLGKIIGKRSWGGVIGIRGSLPLIDGGYLNRPEFANFGADGTWILEGVGMNPDIEIENDPAKEFIGIDEQLDKAIEVILEEIPKNTKTQIPNVPPYPNKSK